MVVVLCYLVCAMVWSTTWFAIRVCIRAGDGYATFPAAALRFTIAAAILGALVALGLGRPGPRGRRQIAWLVAAGVANAIGYAMIYRAEEVLPGGVVAVVFGTYPLFTALVAAATGTEKIALGDVGAALLSLVGMTIRGWDRLGVSAEQAAGVGFVLVGVAGSVGYNIIFKREAKGVSPFSSTALFLAVGAGCIWLFALAGGDASLPWPPPPEPTAALLYLAVLGSVVTFVCYFYLLQRVTLMTASTLVLIQPVIALLVDAAWER
ncbi:MAG TPA: DMT family transporter, partial [Kofleriaceae bacterium]|nr:DMT family transporter [Kofleriaceae bacterium]